MMKIVDSIAWGIGMVSILGVVVTLGTSGVNAAFNTNIPPIFKVEIK